MFWPYFLLVVASNLGKQIILPLQRTLEQNQSMTRAVYMYAHRYLERQLTEGSPGEGDMVARPRHTRRAPDARNQAGRPRRAARRRPAGALRPAAPWRSPTHSPPQPTTLP